MRAARGHLLDVNLSGVQWRAGFEFLFMSRIPREFPDLASGVKFQQVMDEVRRAEMGEDRPSLQGSEAPHFSTSFLTSAIFSTADKPSSTAGGGSHWAAALAWIQEQEEATAIQESQRPADESAETILVDLGLSENLTYDEITQLRRLYMWRNHPDRLGEAQRENATRRVAIANMLLDCAQSRLARRRRV
jgi:hypothetical protein